MALKIEELLKPRWKVIADYPKSLYHVGDILNGDWRSEDLIYCDTEGPRHYPHLFQKLKWWQERKIEDMPEYLKYMEGAKIGQVIKIERWDKNLSSFTPFTKDDKDKVDWHFYKDIAEPATLEEYTHYINKNKQAS